MSRFDYIASRDIAGSDPPFYAILMAAMRKADTANGEKLRAAFPDVWDELMARYNAPGGFLPGDPELAQAGMLKEDTCRICGRQEDDMRECYGADTPDGKHCDHWHYEETGVGCCWCGKLLPDVDPATRQIMSSPETSV